MLAYAFRANREQFIQTINQLISSEDRTPQEELISISFPSGVILDSYNVLDQAKNWLVQSSGKWKDDEEAGPFEPHKRIGIILADVELARRQFGKAMQYLVAARDWALAADNKIAICTAMLVAARVALAEWRTAHDNNRVATVRQEIAAGLRIAQDYGFGLLHLELLNLRAEAALWIGDATSAERDARMTLYGLAPAGPGSDIYDTPPLDEDTPPEQRGIFPPPETGRPELLAATHPECGHVWGEIEARHLFGEALLLRAARGLGSATYVPHCSRRCPAISDD